jgi:hypothetical protein
MTHINRRADGPESRTYPSRTREGSRGHGDSGIWGCYEDTVTGGQEAQGLG